MPLLLDMQSRHLASLDALDVLGSPLPSPNSAVVFCKLYTTKRIQLGKITILLNIAF
jgi:hypothetical protein